MNISRYIRFVKPWSFLLLTSCLCNSGLAAPSVLVAPANMVTSDSIAGSGTLKRSLRVQEVYGAVHFPTGGLVITELRFRPDYYYGFAFTNTVTTLQVRLSTTTAEPERLSSVFAQNVGADETV